MLKTGGAENFKDRLYKNYRSTHNAHLYGELSLQSIVNNFPVWRYYYASHLPTDMNASILEIGCGDGAFVYFLSKMGFGNVTGIDVSEEQVSVGRNLDIPNLQVGDALEFLKSKRESYDLILARDVIEHFDRNDVFELVQKISIALRPSGKFIMQVPNGEGFFFSSIFYGDYTHETAFTVSSVRQLFLNTGFVKSECYPTGPVPYSWKARIRHMLWALKVFVHRFWKMVETGNATGIFTSNLIAVGTKE